MSTLRVNFNQNLFVKVSAVLFRDGGGRNQRPSMCEGLVISQIFGDLSAIT